MFDRGLCIYDLSEVTILLLKSLRNTSLPIQLKQLKTYTSLFVT